MGSSGENKPTGRYQILDKAQLAAKQSVITLAAIGIAELIVTIFTGSITLTADGLDSLADAMISFIVWFGFGGGAFVQKQKPHRRVRQWGFGNSRTTQHPTAALHSSRALSSNSRMFKFPITNATLACGRTCVNIIFDTIILDYFDVHSRILP